MEKLRLGKQGSWPGSQRPQAHQRQGHDPGWPRRGRGTLAEGSPPGVHPGPQAAHRGSKALLEWTLGRGPVPSSANLPSPPRAHLFHSRHLAHGDTCAGRAQRRARPAWALGAGTTGGLARSRLGRRDRGAGRPGRGLGRGLARWRSGLELEAPPRLSALGRG